MRHFHRYRTAVRIPFEWDQRRIAEKNAPRAVLQQDVLSNVLRRLDLLSIGNGLQFHFAGAVSQIAEHDLVVVPSPNLTQAHPFGHQGADVREQLWPGRPVANVCDVTDDTRA